MSLIRSSRCILSFQPSLLSFQTLLRLPKCITLSSALSPSYPFKSSTFSHLMDEYVLYHYLAASSLLFPFGTSHFCVSPNFLFFRSKSTPPAALFTSTLFRVLECRASCEFFSFTCIRQRLLHIPKGKPLSHWILTQFLILSPYKNNFARFLLRLHHHSRSNAA